LGQLDAFECSRFYLSVRLGHRLGGEFARVVRHAQRLDGTYKPYRIEIHESERVRLKFVRKESNPCTREVVFPKLGLRRELPTNQPVSIELSGLAPGEYEFKCGMNMIRGTLVVTAHAHH